VSDQRTEQPTARRLDEARRRGQGVGRSPELVAAATLGAGIVGLSVFMPGAAASISNGLRTSLQDLAAGPGATPSLLLERTGSGVGSVLGLVLPLAVTVMVAGIVANLAAGGPIFSLASLRVDMSRLNPISGVRRLLDKAALQRLVIALVKLAILTAVSWQVVSGRIPGLMGLDGADASAIAASALAAMFELGITVTLLLGAVALADFVLQRRRAHGALRMTREEVRQEAKDQEGDPLIRGQRRRRARQLAFSRMMDAVPTADVVVVNPIHLAVALKYDSLTMAAPRIVAKGQRLVAARIRDVARANGVAVVEDKPLARALFPRPIGSEVPAHLYRAVARILVLVQQARFGRRPAGASWAGQASPTTTDGELPPWMLGGAR
jgi:flagellar biosynthetic protein FlhB